MLSAFFTETCPACGGYSCGGFCADCVAELPCVAQACERCGLPRPVAYCPRRGATWHVDAVIAPFVFRPPLDHYVHALKYGGARSLGRAFARLLTPAVRAAAADIDALVAVPLHRTRLRERGYNQAAEIGRALGRELGLPLLQHRIERQRGSPSQTTQGAGQRWASVADAFTVRRSLAGQRLAIVDDVITTGATVNALAVALRTAGAARCVAFALARTPAA